APVGRVRLEAEERREHEKGRRRRPSLGAAADRVGGWLLGELSGAGEPAVQLGQAEEPEALRGLEDLLEDFDAQLALTVPKEPRNGDRVVVRPDRAVVVAHGVVAGRVTREGAQAPSGEQV